MARLWWLLACGVGGVALGALGCGDDEPPLPPGAPDPGRGDADPRPEPGEVAGCADATLYANPEDLAEAGPWPVGVRTVTLDGLTTEIWYPAERDSQVGARRVLYDLRAWLPPDEAEKIPDEATAWQICECYRDLPVDATRGPYPLLVFAHGTAGFRTQSLAFMVHWASRGFVVVAADHPRLVLGELLEDPFGNFGQADQAGDVGRVLDALEAGHEEAAFLEGRVELGRIGMAGHSAGGNAIGGLGDRARVLMPMAAGGVEPGTALESALVLGAMDDAVVPYASTVEAYEDSPAPKRLLGIADAGHLAFSDICAITNAEGQNILDIALEHEVTNAEFAEVLFDGCTPEHIEPTLGWEITQLATSGVLQEVLHCQDGATQPLEEVTTRYPLAADYRSEP